MGTERAPASRPRVWSDGVSLSDSIWETRLGVRPAFSASVFWRMPRSVRRPRIREPSDTVQPRTYSKSTACPLMPRAGGAIQLANFPRSMTGTMRLCTKDLSFSVGSHPAVGRHPRLREQSDPPMEAAVGQAQLEVDSVLPDGLIPAVHAALAVRDV